LSVQFFKLEFNFIIWCANFEAKKHVWMLKSCLGESCTYEIIFSQKAMVEMIGDMKSCVELLEL
jgi:hypothetical protein